MGCRIAQTQHLRFSPSGPSFKSHVFLNPSSSTNERDFANAVSCKGLLISTTTKIYNNNKGLGLSVDNLELYVDSKSLTIFFCQRPKLKQKDINDIFFSSTDNFSRARKCGTGIGFRSISVVCSRLAPGRKKRRLVVKQSEKVDRSCVSERKKNLRG